MHIQAVFLYFYCVSTSFIALCIPYFQRAVHTCKMYIQYCECTFKHYAYTVDVFSMYFYCVSTSFNALCIPYIQLAVHTCKVYIKYCECTFKQCSCTFTVFQQVSMHYAYRTCNWLYIHAKCI